ncbi:hypothetical protein [Thermosporothrix hazakensis]|uniref:hypothetical protein n=1 Tax=Thermosporothrix hazakensis TaxID=644383 RepID=UPI0010F724C4|nr:hypothetical protein [Thermosporothrix hazakensis]
MAKDRRPPAFDEEKGIEHDRKKKPFWAGKDEQNHETKHDPESAFCSCCSTTWMGSSSSYQTEAGSSAKRLHQTSSKEVNCPNERLLPW